MLEVIDICQKLQILLIALPANATHLFQPLDVAVFRPFKQTITQKLQQHTMISSAHISKKKAIDIACASYKKSIIDCPRNIVSGFTQTGLFPISYPQMLKRWLNFQNGGIKKDLGSEAWLKRKVIVQDEILLLPAIPKQQKKKRKTVDVSGRLLTKALLHSQ